MAKIIIHVNRHVIKANLKSGRRDPVFSVKQGKKNVKVDEVIIEVPCRLVYRPDKPLKCGATVWIETSGIVKTK